MSDWKRAIKPSDEGEVGKVYYLNWEIVHNVKYGTESKRESWYDCRPFTLNPERGKTIELLLKTSKTLLKTVKEQLLKKRVAEYHHSGGKLMKCWISHYPAPRTMGDDVIKKLRGNNERRTSSLIGLDGKRIKY